MTSEISEREVGKAKFELHPSNETAKTLNELNENEKKQHNKTKNKTNQKIEDLQK